MTDPKPRDEAHPRDPAPRPPLTPAQLAGLRRVDAVAARLTAQTQADERGRLVGLMKHAAKHCRDRFTPAMHGLLASHPEVTPEQAAAAMLAELQALDPTTRRRVEERLLVLGLATVWENTRLVAGRNEP